MILNLLMMIGNERKSFEIEIEFLMILQKRFCICEDEIPFDEENLWFCFIFSFHFGEGHISPKGCKIIQMFRFILVLF